MQEIIDIIQPLRGAGAAANAKARLKDLGYLFCANVVDVKHAPFYEPCAILVLTGTKTLYEEGRPVVAKAGEVLAVPAPRSYNMRNTPDPRSRRYEALVIPFTTSLLNQLMRAHSFLYEIKQDDVALLTFEADATLHHSIAHYLSTVDNPALLNHRLMEILLILASKNPQLLAYTLQPPGWSQRVRAVLSQDLAHTWEIAEVCQRLATSESTLRRNLREEATNFRTLLHELRLTAALMQLMQTSLPIYRIALDCGYQSVSRFTQNFHERFGLPPRQFRENMSEAEQKLAVSGQQMS